MRASSPLLLLLLLLLLWLFLLQPCLLADAWIMPQGVSLYGRHVVPVFRQNTLIGMERKINNDQYYDDKPIPMLRPQPPPRRILRPVRPRVAVAGNSGTSATTTMETPNVNHNSSIINNGGGGRWEDVPLHPATYQAIKTVCQWDQLTPIQAQTYAAATATTTTDRPSLVIQAPTGTGKTAAYLLPMLEQLVSTTTTRTTSSSRKALLSSRKDDDDDENNEQGTIGTAPLSFRPGHSVGMLIVVPTRELARQITDQARQLLTFHNQQHHHSSSFDDSGKDDTDHYFSVLCCVGGTKLAGEVTQLHRRIPTILVATPGRLLDHLEGPQKKSRGSNSHRMPSSPTRIRGRKFAQYIQDTSMLVLDEGDRLLEAFFHEIKTIIKYLPRCDKRQTLFVSATLPRPPALQSCVDHGILPAKYAVLVDNGLVNQTAKTTSLVKGKRSIISDRLDSTARVEETYLLLPNMDVYTTTLITILRQILSEQSNSISGSKKVIVFFPTAKLVKFFAEMLTSLDMPVWEMHSRLSQGSRNRVRQEFLQPLHQDRILLTSDVSARGVDYPDITHVIQVRSMMVFGDFPSVAPAAVRALESHFAVLFYFKVWDPVRS